ncbi:septal ring lytic transglycosylase RlpA family protein [Flavobacterium restrictum]|uniref:Probable endolytic peptidoglycan transglycosylase RlpA n=1 Tax=Flavobacterium restrictum TaxID=2594428 RepID=A0A553E650_9FLAO|nr:septal ring lytic transglycosylase RlpA family protein [Flavobacterium restrictum]TRX40480.1 septal ring lytic transglycosylase RlpA family protein [Flavobacterium restrictum]
MKKIISVFILLAIVGFVYSQSPSALKPKGATSKDTIKKNKTAIAPQPVLPEKDTTVVVPSKFKFYKKNGHASYYAEKFTGKRTASGKKFNNNSYTAAHKKLPFGTMIKVTNEANGKSVIVEVTDRGPFVRTREIDLSRKAFMEISEGKGGQMKVTIETAEK